MENKVYDAVKVEQECREKFRKIFTEYFKDKSNLEKTILKTYILGELTDATRR